MTYQETVRFASLLARALASGLAGCMTEVARTLELSLLPKGQGLPMEASPSSPTVVEQTAAVPAPAASVPGAPEPGVPAAAAPTPAEVLAPVEKTPSNVVKLHAESDVFDIETATRSDLIKKMKQIDPPWVMEEGIKRQTLQRLVRAKLAGAVATEMKAEAAPAPLDTAPAKASAPEPLPKPEPASAPGVQISGAHKPPGILTDAATVIKGQELMAYLHGHAQKKDADAKDAADLKAIQESRAKVIAFWGRTGCDAQCVREGGVCEFSDTCYRFVSGEAGVQLRTCA